MSQTNSTLTAAPSAAAAAAAPARPRALTVIAIYMIVIGALTILPSLRQRNLYALLVALFNIATGIGLLKVKGGWRIAALSWFGLMMGLCALSLIALMRTGGTRPLMFQQVHNPGVNAGVTVFTFLVAALCYHGLTRPPVKAAFGIR